MSILQAIVVAIVEGLTEFLPVSSTGHMILAQHLLGVEPTTFVKAFTVNIQLGAILAVVVLYRQRFFRVSKVDEAALGTVRGAKRLLLRLGAKYDFYVKLLVAFLPAAVVGFCAGDYIDTLLESVPVVALMLVLGGLFMLFVDRLFGKPRGSQGVGAARALKIGLAQCVAMIPGVSRSAATIVGGMATGLSRQAAAEFSFFLAVPTMLAASAYKLLKDYKVLFAADNVQENLALLGLGNLVAFVVGMFAIRFFITFLTRYGFKAFGWYRIVVGGAILALTACGVNLTIT
ncbi:MAG: undecaprenyl-diphosphate phosphatase [Prevotellaceae bacterium]|jgi:undecaprenyl-diphosphatase|nr:undecaprenyl-diphosphate phosphatase [Prevotellaceae bacterium]